MRNFRLAGSLAILSLMFLTAGAQAQDRDRMRDPGRDGPYTRITPGTMISVRPNEAIDVERKDYRVYRGIVDQDVRGDNGRLAWPALRH